jgi:hypothetical protein
VGVESQWSSPAGELLRDRAPAEGDGIKLSRPPGRVSPDDRKPVSHTPATQGTVAYLGLLVLDNLTIRESDDELPLPPLLRLMVSAAINPGLDQAA